MSAARSVLQVLTLMSHREDGVRAGEVAEALDKSVSTAYELLGALCREGFAVHVDGAYHLASEANDLFGGDPHLTGAPGLETAVDELFARTHKRVYLAAARSGDIIIPLVRGKQGMPRIPGLGPRIRENAHALALGKIALSLLDEPGLARYLSRGLRRFTASTITDPGLLRAQLSAIRDGEVAVDREELAENFCCLAAPVRTSGGRVVAALGMSMSARCFELEREELTDVLHDVTGRASTALGATAVPAIPEEPADLERPRRTLVRSPAAAVHAPGHTGEEATR